MNIKQLIRKQEGFTLIEILVVIGLIAVLAAVVLVAINPARQFAQAHNSQRQANVQAILDATGQYIADNKGATPAAITITATNVSKAGIDICSLLVPTYISALPSDPTAANGGASITDCTTAYNTEYQVSKDANGRITIAAPNTEKPPAAANVSVTR